jgi:hypothetical protein
MTEKLSEGESVVASERIARLKALQEKLCGEKHVFKMGQPVRWKKGLKNRRRPTYNEPAIVVKVLSEAVFDSKDEGASTPYFQEPLDILLGLLDEDDDLIVFHFDSRRFEPFPNR